MKPFLVIPAYNEEKTILKVIKSSKKYINDIIVIDDCSLDNTYNLAIKTGVNVIKLNENVGYDKALELGFEFALRSGATSIISFDADGQHPYDRIIKMINFVEIDKFDLVIGVRSELPRISEKTIFFLTNIRFSINDITCGMKCYQSDLFAKFKFSRNYDSTGTYLTLYQLKMDIVLRKLIYQ